jgi:hypothetical protein
MFFWGPLTGPGAIKEKRMVASLRNRRFYFFIIGLEPDGCLVADQLRIRTKKFEITGAGTEKRLTPLLEDVPAKKNVAFLRWRGVFS